MKYIIKNCPNLTTGYYGTGETIHNQCGLSYDDLCQNINYCVLKQIADICKAEKDKGFCLTRYGAKAPVSEGWDLASEILERLEIEECE